MKANLFALMLLKTESLIRTGVIEWIKGSEGSEK